MQPVRRHLTVLPLLFLGLTAPAADTNGIAAAKPVDYFIIITGGELLAGAIADAHTPFLTKTLLPLGLNCVGMMIVDDRDEDLQAALKFATNKAPLVIVTGGLGPTDNDITRQTLSKFTGIPLREHPDLLKEMAARLNTPITQLRANLRRQTEVPVRGSYLKNPSGSAAGLIYDLGQVHIVALPGPPRELQPMVKESLVPVLAKHHGTRASAASITLRFLGLGQSQIDATIKQNITLPADLITASQFEGGRVDFTFSLPDDSAAAWQRLLELKVKIYKCLGQSIYAEGATNLEEVVLLRLQQRGAKIALAEIASGGGLGAALSKVPPATNTLAGEWMAPTEAGLFRALQLPEAQGAGLARLQAAAAHAGKAAQADCVLVVGAPQPDQTVLAVLKTPGGQWESQSFSYRPGETAQAQLVTQLLGWLWKKLP